MSRLSDTDIPVCADEAESLDHMGLTFMSHGHCWLIGNSIFRGIGSGRGLADRLGDFDQGNVDPRGAHRIPARIPAIAIGRDFKDGNANGFIRRWLGWFGTGRLGCRG